MPHRNSTKSHGFRGVNTALEMQEFRESIKDAIRETVVTTIEEKGASSSAPSTLEQAIALRQLKTAHEAQKREISDLPRTVLLLTTEVRELRNLHIAGGDRTARGNNDDDKENARPNSAWRWSTTSPGATRSAAGT